MSHALTCPRNSVSTKLFVSQGRHPVRFKLNNRSSRSVSPFSVVSALSALHYSEVTQPWWTTLSYRRLRASRYCYTIATVSANMALLLDVWLAAVASSVFLR